MRLRRLKTKNFKGGWVRRKVIESSVKHQDYTFHITTTALPIIRFNKLAVRQNAIRPEGLALLQNMSNTNEVIREGFQERMLSYSRSTSLAKHLAVTAIQIGQGSAN